MADEMLDLLAPTKVITDKIQDIIDAFVDYYGEDRREEITEKIRNAILVKVCSNYDLARIIKNIKTQVFSDVFGVPNDTMYIDGDEFLESLSSEHFKYCYIGREAKRIIAGNPYLGDEDIFEGYKRGEFPKLEEYVRKYKAIKEKLAPFEKEVDENKLRIEEARFNCYKKLVDDFKFLFTKEEYNEFLRTKQPTYSMIRMLGSSIRDGALAFDEDSDRIIDSPNEPDWKKDSYKEDRTRLASILYHKDPKNPKRMFSYDDFVNNPLLRPYLEQARELFGRIETRRKELKTTLNEQETYALADYQRNKKLYNWNKLIDKNHPFGPLAYISNCAWFGPNYIRTISGLKFKPIIIANMNFPDFDITIIHELNHMLEFYAYSLDKESISSVTGWDQFDYYFGNEQDNSDPTYQGITRPYEFLSEFINERIATEITERMHAKGKFILTHETESSASYLIIQPLFEEFFQTYKHDIIVSRKDGQLSFLTCRIGEDNFNELNNIANDFYKEFGTGKSFIWEEYEKRDPNNMTERIAKLDALVKRKDALMKTIKETYTRNCGYKPLAARMG